VDILEGITPAYILEGITPAEDIPRWDSPDFNYLGLPTSLQWILSVSVVRDPEVSIQILSSLCPMVVLYAKSVEALEGFSME